MSTPLTLPKYLTLWLLSLTLVAATFALCICIGPGEPGTRAIHFAFPTSDEFSLRIMRILPAALVGLALSASGVALQALLRNPLADPYVLGISSGSSVGVLLWLLTVGPFYAAVTHSDFLRILLKQGALLPALAGAIITCILVFLLARSRKSAGGSADSLTLLLVGVIISAVNGALLMLLNHFAPLDVRLDLQNYMMGAISNDVTPITVAIAALIIAIGYLPLLLAGKSLNIGSLSDTEATSLGVNIKSLRQLCFISASVMTAASIILSGPIGFVGLICPHICRALLGADHRKLLVAAPLIGAAFLMLADTFVSATGNLFHGELPVGVITALCGGPFFLFLLHRRTAGGTP